MRNLKSKLMRITYFILIVALISAISNTDIWAQPLTVEYIDQYISSCDPEIDLTKKERLYVIEGVPLEGEMLIEKLNSFDISNQYVFIDYLNSDEVESTFFKPNLIVVLVGSSRKLRMKERKNQLSTIKSRFTDVYDIQTNQILSEAKDPVLVLNGEVVLHSKAFKTINDLVAKKIERVITLNHCPGEVYGQNAKNGIIKIWTK